MAKGGDATSEALESLITGLLEDDKAEDIISIDLRGKSSVTDFMIIASGRSHRHVGAIADHVIRALKESGHGRARAEGLATADWVLIDAGDVVVHLFRPEVRTFYNLERMWSVDSPEKPEG
ncbi:MULTISPECIES: ribosome silencing factor [unclassified Hyphobacterium]|uniref:ribosome silencing factor n=1 Tax=unclassified Hyphobacterium TaxID=2638931 RepID=UPI00351CB0F0